MAQVKIHRKATYGSKIRSPPNDDLVGKALGESSLKCVFDISDLAPCDELPVLGKDLESADKHPLKQSEAFLSGQDNLETEWALFPSGVLDDQIPCFNSLDKMPPTASDSIFGLPSECKKAKSLISPEKQRPNSEATFSFSGNLSDFLSSISIEDGDDTKRSSFSSDLKSGQQNNVSLSDLFKGASIEFGSSSNSEKCSHLSCSLGSSCGDSSVSTSLSESPQSVENRASNNFLENADEKILNFNLPTVDRESWFLDWSLKNEKCKDKDDIMLDLLQSIDLTTPSISFVRGSVTHHENNEDGLQDLLNFSNTTNTEKENTNTFEYDQPQADNAFSNSTAFSNDRLSPIVDLSQCLKKENKNENVDIPKDEHVESLYQNPQDLNSELIITPHGIELHEANNSTELIPNSNQTLFSMSLSCKIRQNKEAKQKALRIQREMYSNLIRWRNLGDLKPKPSKWQPCIEELTIHSHLKFAIGRYKYGSCT